MGPTPAPNTQSGLHATILLCSATMCAGLVAVCFAVLGPGKSNASEKMLFDLNNDVAPADTLAEDADTLAEDTGHWEDDELDDELEDERDDSYRPVAAPSGHRPDHSPSVTGNNTTASRGTLTIRLPDPRGVSSIAVTCPSGFTGRSVLRQSAHVVADVPAESCTLWFRGSSPYKFVGATGGQTLTCNFRSGLALCE